MHHIDSGIKENFFQWKGRLNRKRFLSRLLVLFGVSIALYILLVIGVISVGADIPEDTDGAFGAFSLLYLPITISSYMLMIRRLHDVNLSGFFVLLALIPIVSLGLALYLLFKQGTVGDNNYGPDPLIAAGDTAAAAAPANPYARATYADTPTDIAPPKPEDPRV